MDTAEVVIRSNAVFTGTGLAPFKGGVAVKGDKIIACGEDKYLDTFIGPDIPSFDKPVGTPMAAPFLMCWAYATSPDGLDLEPRPPGASAVATDAAGHSPLSLVPQ